MKKLHRYLLGLLFCFAVPSASATDLQVRAAELVGYGIFEARDMGSSSSATSRAYRSDGVSRVRFTDYTNEIPGELGVNFGIQYVVNTTPKGRPMQVRQVIRFPEGGLQVPGGRHYTESEQKGQITIGRKAFYGFGFDEPYEIIPGEWAIEIWHGSARLISKKFTVLPPTVDRFGSP